MQNEMQSAGEDIRLLYKRNNSAHGKRKEWRCPQGHHLKMQTRKVRESQGKRRWGHSCA